MLKKISYLLAASVAAIGASVSYSQAGEVTVWAWDPNFNIAIMKEAAERYQKSHPETTFNIVDFSQDDLKQKLQVALASGASGVLPDITLIEDYSAQRYLTSFPGAFEPLNGKIDHSAFAQYKVSVMTVGDDIYGVPFDSGASAMFYRSDYLADAGFSADDMKDITWDRFLEIAEAVKAKTGHAMMALDLGDADFISMLMQSGGEWYVKEDGSINVVGNKALAAALETFKKLANSDAVLPANDWADWVGKFTSGDAASVTTGVWIIGTVKSSADQAGKWGVAATPRLSIDGAANASNRGGSSWYVLESSEEKAEAIDFLKTELVEDIGLYQNILKERGAVGTLLAASEGEVYSSPDAFFGGEYIWKDISNWMSKIPAVNYGAYTNEFHDAIKSNLPAYLKGRIDVDQMLQAVERQAKGQIQ
ncbi:extracellular solute-binding protein [uncultured Cohaesibacter sp.]|uniref:ABC transporter substrate-binding protein n=1 Tax=uncultured Cohaesibacter sp. TaxID=1002546 RepID=UPI00292DE8A3|nr:extracellular solute-binding protein [uncultured Cohaesibacter sp.]